MILKLAGLVPAAPFRRNALAQHRLIVARAFHIVGWALGAPAALAALSLGVGAFILGHGPPPDHSAPLSLHTYGLVGLLANGAHGVAAALAFMSKAVSWALAGLALAALIVALFAGLIHWIGRGLRASALWARILGGLITAILLLYAVLALSLLSRVAQIIDSLAVASFVYVLWVLGWRFADPPP